jgi:BolA protein
MNAHQAREPTMSAEDEIKIRLMTALEPTRLDVINESHLHAGHRSSPGTGESHFRVTIVSSRFAGCSRVDRHRMVNAALEGLVGGRVHALALHAFAPGEPIRS